MIGGLNMEGLQSPCSAVIARGTDYFCMKTDKILVKYSKTEIEEKYIFLVENRKILVD